MSFIGHENRRFSRQESVTIKSSPFSWKWVINDPSSGMCGFIELQLSKLNSKRELSLVKKIAAGNSPESWAISLSVFVNLTLSSRIRSATINLIQASQAQQKLAAGLPGSHSFCHRRAEPESVLSSCIRLNDVEALPSRRNGGIQWLFQE